MQAIASTSRHAEQQRYDAVAQSIRGWTRPPRSHDLIPLPGASFGYSAASRRPRLSSPNAPRTVKRRAAGRTKKPASVDAAPARAEARRRRSRRHRQQKSSQSDLKYLRWPMGQGDDRERHPCRRMVRPRKTDRRRKRVSRHARARPRYRAETASASCTNRPTPGGQPQHPDRRGRRTRDAVCTAPWRGSSRRVARRGGDAAKTWCTPPCQVDRIRMIPCPPSGRF